MKLAQGTLVDVIGIRRPLAPSRSANERTGRFPLGAPALSIAGRVHSLTMAYVSRRVNARLKLHENQRFEIAMAVRPARSFECPRCSSPAGLHRRSLGGKRGPGGSRLSRPQPPEAVAEGQSLQGTVTRPRSVTEGDDRECMWRQV